MKTKTNYLNEILLRRKNKVTVITVGENVTDNLGRVMVMMKNVQDIGFTFSKELIS